MPTDRDALVASAVAFLQNPAVAGSPLARKVAFLQSKGLNQAEIDTALGHLDAPPLPPMLPQMQSWGLRDAAMASIAASGIALSLLSVLKFLLPRINGYMEFTNRTEAALESQRLLARVQSMQDSQNAVLKELECLNDRMDATLRSVQSLAASMARRDEFHDAPSAMTKVDSGI